MADKTSTDLAVLPLSTQYPSPDSLPEWKAAIESLPPSKLNLVLLEKTKDAFVTLQNLAKKRKESLQKVLFFGEIMLRALVAEGEMIPKMVRPGNPQLSRHAIFRLSDLGIDKDESHRAQLAASVPKAIFEDWIRAMKGKQQELTCAGLLKLAISLRLQAPRRSFDFNLPRIPVTERGDVWRLGSHVLHCGDAHRLLNKQKPVGLILCDPPFGQNVQYGRSNLGHRVVAGDTNLDWLPTFAKESYKVLPENSASLLFGQWRTGDKFRTEFERQGFRTRTVAIWDTGVSGLGSGLAEQYEQINVFFKGTPKISGFRGNVFRERRISGRPEHPNEKPVELFIDLMALFPSRDVLDPFLGTGPTLMAAEKLDRTCFGYEIQPEYCDIAVRRWQNFTGLEATLDSTGETFDEVYTSRFQKQRSLSRTTHPNVNLSPETSNSYSCR